MYIKNKVLRLAVSVAVGGFHALAGIFCAKYLYFRTGSIDWYTAPLFIALLMGIWWEFFSKPANTQKSTSPQIQ